MIWVRSSISCVYLVMLNECSTVTKAFRHFCHSRVSFLYQFLIDHLSPAFPFLCSHMWQVLLFIIIGWAERSVPRFKFSSAPSSFLLSGYFHRNENHLPHSLLILHSRDLHCSYSSSAIHHPEFSYQKKYYWKTFQGYFVLDLKICFLVWFLNLKETWGRNVP